MKQFLKGLIYTIVIMFGGCTINSKGDTQYQSTENPDKEENNSSIIVNSKTSQEKFDATSKQLILLENEFLTFQKKWENKELPKLETLIIRDEIDCNGCEFIGNISSLTYLSFEGLTCENLPSKFGELKAIKNAHLVLEINAESAPKVISNWQSLEELTIEGINLVNTGGSILKLSQLRTLDFQSSPIQVLDDRLAKMPNLQEIYLGLTEGIEKEIMRFQKIAPHIKIHLL